MNHEQNIEQALRHAARQLSNEVSMSEAVMSRIERIAPPRPRPKRRFARPWFIGSLGVAAGVAIAVGAWLLVSAGSATLIYADVVKALEKVRTVRYQAQVGPSGETVTCTYERGVGFRLEGVMEGSQFLIIDNGKRQWIRTGDDVKERDSNGLIESLTKALVANEYLEGAKHDRSGDETIDGERCRMFAKPPQDNMSGTRVWLDDQDRLRKLEIGRVVDGKWLPEGTATAKYDVPVDRKLFDPPATPGRGKPVDLTAMIAAQFSDDRALAKAEVFGLVLTIHEARRGDDGSVLVRSSIKPTADTLAKYGDGGPFALVLGNYELQCDQPEGYTLVPIGTVQAQRLFARWDLLVPLKPNSPPPASVQVSARYVLTVNEVWQSLREQKQETDASNIKLPAFQPPAEQKKLDDLIVTAWDQARSLDSPYTPVTLSEAARKHPKGKWAFSTTRMKNWTLERLRSELALEVRQRREEQITVRRAVETRD